MFASHTQAIRIGSFQGVLPARSARFPINPEARVAPQCSSQFLRRQIRDGRVYAQTSNVNAVTTMGSGAAAGSTDINALFAGAMPKGIGALEFLKVITVSSRTFAVLDIRREYPQIFAKPIDCNILSQYDMSLSCHRQSVVPTSQAFLHLSSNAFTES